MIHASDLYKSYQTGATTLPVLRGVDLEIAAGSFTALLGPSGSGKSTLLSLIGGLEPADRGRLTVAGVEVVGLAPEALRRFRATRIGFVFQSPHLLPTLTAQENVEIASGDPRRAAAMLEAVGLGDRLDAWPDQLSGGERQRVALARALVHRPPLILADEPTGSLDQQTGARVLDLLGQIRHAGATLLVVTHDPAVAARADRTIRLRDGRVVEEQAG